MAAPRKTRGPAFFAAERQEKKKLRQGIILLIVLLLIVIGCGTAIWYLDNCLYEENRRFILKDIEIVSSGFWGKSEENRRALIRKLALELGKDNLFKLNYKKLRQDLRSMPNIADAQVRMQLPDKISIEIEERIPRAFLGRSRSDLVVDANGMVMSAKQCFGVHPKLPVIVGFFHNGVRPGSMQPALREALALIMSVQQHSCFSVALVGLNRDDTLTVFMYYRNARIQRRYHVTMPRGNYRELLDILRSAIEDALQHNDTRKNINLTFDGAVIMSH